MIAKLKNIAHITFNWCIYLKEKKLVKEKDKFLGNHDNKRQVITDNDVELFKQKNNLKTDRDAIGFLIKKLSISGGEE